MNQANNFIDYKYIKTQQKIPTSYSTFSSYVLVMTAIDRYQAICNPLSNCSWTPKRSHIMIAVAWTISLLLCIPQTIIFSTNKDEHHCGAVSNTFYYIILYHIILNNYAIGCNADIFLNSISF